MRQSSSRRTLRKPHECSSPQQSNRNSCIHRRDRGASPAIIILSLYKERGTCPSFPGKHAISLKMRPRHCSFTLLLLFLFQSAIYMYFCSHYYFHRSFVHRWGTLGGSSLSPLSLSILVCVVYNILETWALEKKKIRQSPRFLLPKFNSVQSIF